jgi:hypothetical protein
MPSVETDNVARKQSSHHCSQGDFAASKEEMCMIWKEGPSIARSLRLRQQGREAIQEISTIFIVPEDLSTFDPPDHEVMQNTGRI